MKNCIFIFLIFFSSCFSSEKRDIQYIVFGSYCGECNEHCATMYKIDASSIQIDSSDSFFSSNYTGTYHFNGQVLDSNTKNTFEELKHSFPAILNTSGMRYGKPDEYDQCGIYIQIEENGRLKDFHIDTNEKVVPSDINKYVKQLFSVVKR